MSKYSHICWDTNYKTGSRFKEGCDFHVRNAEFTFPIWYSSSVVKEHIGKRLWNKTDIKIEDGIWKANRSHVSREVCPGQGKTKPKLEATQSISVSRTG
jgi:hypothetical protein